jgi:molecular chaperone HscB
MTSNPFELFGLPNQFALDAKLLETRHRELSKTVHPDKFTDAGASAKKSALSHAVSVNEAYRALRDPIERAVVLARAHGLTLPENVALSPAFLMEVMEMRETLAEIRKDEARLHALLKEAQASARELEMKVDLAFQSPALNGTPESRAAHAQTLAGLIAQMRYVRRFAEEVDMKLEVLDGAS